MSAVSIPREIFLFFSSSSAILYYHSALARVCCLDSSKTAVVTVESLPPTSTSYCVFIILPLHPVAGIGAVASVSCKMANISCVLRQRLLPGEISSLQNISEGKRPYFLSRATPSPREGWYRVRDCYMGGKHGANFFGVGAVNVMLAAITSCSNSTVLFGGSDSLSLFFEPLPWLFLPYMCVCFCILATFTHDLSRV